MKTLAALTIALAAVAAQGAACASAQSYRVSAKTHAYRVTAFPHSYDLNPKSHGYGVRPNLDFSARERRTAGLKAESARPAWGNVV